MRSMCLYDLRMQIICQLQLVPLKSAPSLQLAYSGSQSASSAFVVVYMGSLMAYIVVHISQLHMRCFIWPLVSIKLFLVDKTKTKVQQKHATKEIVVCVKEFVTYSISYEVPC